MPGVPHESSPRYRFWCRANKRGILGPSTPRQRVDSDLIFAPAEGAKIAHFSSMRITQDVRDYAAQHGIAEETAALVQGLKEKAEEFRKSGGEIYRRA